MWGLRGLPSKVSMNLRRGFPSRRPFSDLSAKGSTQLSPNRKRGPRRNSRRKFNGRLNNGSNAGSPGTPAAASSPSARRVAAKSSPRKAAVKSAPRKAAVKSPPRKAAAKSPTRKAAATSRPPVVDPDKGKAARRHNGKNTGQESGWRAKREVRRQCALPTSGRSILDCWRWPPPRAPPAQQ